MRSELICCIILDLMGSWITVLTLLKCVQKEDLFSVKMTVYFIFGEWELTYSTFEIMWFGFRGERERERDRARKKERKKERSRDWRLNTTAIFPPWLRKKASCKRLFLQNCSLTKPYQTNVNIISQRTLNYFAMECITVRLTSCFPPWLMSSKKASRKRLFLQICSLTKTLSKKCIYN